MPDLNGLPLQPLILLLCLALGYVIKTVNNATVNRCIPLIMFTIGGLMGFYLTPSLEGAVYGIVSGLASTGMHEMFAQWVDKR